VVKRGDGGKFFKDRINCVLTWRNGQSRAKMESLWAVDRLVSLTIPMTDGGVSTGSLCGKKLLN